jgi:hypothetical protein
MKLKSRKILFSLLIATLAGGSMAIYSASDVNFFTKTVELVLFQQAGAVVIYFLCFGWDLFKVKPLKSKPES